MQERTFRTSTHDGEQAATFPAVEDLKCRLKKIVTTDEGAVQLAIELTVRDDDELEQIRDLIRVQQGEVKISINGVQGELRL
jgi:hypothetical protein